MLNRELYASIQGALESMVETYKFFHGIPELSMHEEKTSTEIALRLERLGLTPKRFGGTGVVSVIENGLGATVAYRADIDALPVKEATGLDYASTARGILPDGTETDVMHACGHDTHITIGLYVAQMLLTNRASWSGTVILIFQPGEEIGQGARAMVADGLWDAVPHPVVIYGQHGWAGLSGHLYVKPGTAMALSDCLKVTIRGKQAHGARPQDSVDPIVLGSYMIARMQTIVSREISGTDTAVVTIGTFHGGLKENIIPASAEFTLNIRTFDSAVRQHVLEAVRRIVKFEAKASRADEPRIEELYTFPRCYNDPDHTQALMASFAEEFGGDCVHLDAAHTGSEDFGYFGDSIGVPYVYWHFGAYSADKFKGSEQVEGIHSPYFATDDANNTLTTGVRAALTAILSQVAV